MKGKNSYSLALVKLTRLMEFTSGNPKVKIGLIDGPVITQHSELNSKYLIEISENNPATCTVINSISCKHGTYVAGILSAKRKSNAPAICPDCTLLIRPVFSETNTGKENIPYTTPLELANAITECIYAGARINNLSLALAYSSEQDVHVLEQALGKAMKHGVIVVAAAGNQNTLDSSIITRHQWVIPVIGCNDYGQPMNESNWAISIGRRGLSAPGGGIISLGSEGSVTLSGTSVAVPFVTGAIALLWSIFPDATATQIKLAVTQTKSIRRTSVMPPLLDAAAAYYILLQSNKRRHTA
jgi:subtilisin family serine protease